MKMRTRMEMRARLLGSLWFVATILVLSAACYQVHGDSTRYALQEQGGADAASNASGSVTNGSGSNGSPEHKHSETNFPQLPVCEKELWYDPLQLTSPWSALLYAPACIFVFVCIILVCEEHFMSAVAEAVNILQVSTDTAGATLVALGISLPQLAINLTIFYPDDLYEDRNYLHVVGTIVFTMLVILSILVLASSKGYVSFGLKPAIRDLLFNLVAEIALISIIATRKLRWYHPLILMVLYGSYLVVIRKIDVIIDFVSKRWRTKMKKKGSTSKRGLNSKDSSKNLTIEQGEEEAGTERGTAPEQSAGPEEPAGHVMLHPYRQNRSNPMATARIFDLTNDFDNFLTGPTPTDTDGGDMESRPNNQQNQSSSRTADTKRGTLTPYAADGSISLNDLSISSSVNTGKSETVRNPDLDSRAASGSGQLESQRLSPPAAKRQSVFGLLQRILKLIFVPVVAAFRLTIPECENRRSRWPLTYAFSVLWITLLDVLMVSWLNRVGCVLGIPDSMMALTITAAASTTPTATISWILSRDGFDAMATTVCFATTICTVLPAQAILMIAVVADGKTFSIRQIRITALLMLLSLFIVICAIVTEKRRISQRTAKIFIGLYSAFVLVSLLAGYM